MKIRQITPIISFILIIAFPITAMQKEAHNACWVEDRKKFPNEISRIIAYLSGILDDELARPRVECWVLKRSFQRNNDSLDLKALPEFDLINLLPYKWVAIQKPLSDSQLTLNQLYHNLTFLQALFVKELYDRLGKGKVPQRTDHGITVWKSLPTELQKIIRAKIKAQEKNFILENNRNE